MRILSDAATVITTKARCNCMKNSSHYATGGVAPAGCEPARSTYVTQLVTTLNSARRQSVSGSRRLRMDLRLGTGAAFHISDQRGSILRHLLAAMNHLSFALSLRAHAESPQGGGLST